MTGFQFSDLPQIHVANDSPLNSSWGADDGDYLDSPHYAGTRTVHFGGQAVALDETNLQSMSSMQRYLQERERQFFRPGFLETDFGYTQARQFERIPPFPSVEESPREVSPGWSQSSGSQATQDELRSSRMVHQFAYDEPAMHSHPLLPYPNLDRQTSGTFSQEIPIGGGGIDPRQVEYDHDDELEASIEECDGLEVKYDCHYEHEPEPVYCKMEVENENYQDCHDSTLGESMRDPESVQPVSRDDDGSDSDYKPISPRNKRKRRSSQSSSGSSSRQSQKRANHGRKPSITPVTPSSSKLNKRKSSSSTGLGSNHTSSNTSKANAARPFPCPLALYSCQSTFSSKNEWKRHVSTQHIRLGFWRCDLCPTTVDNHNAVYYNDFNRKDLFTQHLRRMHAAPTHQASSAARNAKSYPVTEDNIAEHQARCYTKIRSAPPRSTCLFCGRSFSGSGSWDERMEHVGRHMEKERKAGGAPLDISEWKEDQVLKKWLITECLIEKDRDGDWKLGDGKAKKDFVYEEEDESDSEDDDESTIKVEV